MNRIKKAVIPAAGLGTRFLPATKSIPKEMLTVVDAPVILYAVEEAVAAGIEDIVLIQGRGKTAIEDFFDVSYELEDKLAKSGKQHLLDRLNKIKSLANIISIRQKQALGLGHAVLTALPVVEGEPFAVLLGDEIMVTEPNQKTIIESLCVAQNDSNLSVVGITEVEAKDVYKYGIAEVETYAKDPGLKQITKLIEKPGAGETNSRWALPGRYAFSPEILKFLKETGAGKNGEIQLTDAMAAMQKAHGMLGMPVSCHRYDAGDVLGFLKANLEMSLRHPEHGAEVKKYIHEFYARGKKEGLL